MSIHKLTGAFLAVMLCFLGIAAPAQQNGPSGQFDYYVLALSWSPQYCAEHGEAPSAKQQGSTAHPTGFVAHGLWPQYAEHGYPASCRPTPAVPANIVNRMLPVMPSQGLIQHEWKNHGSCSGLTMDDYFDVVGQAFRKVQIPALLDMPRHAVTASPQRIRQMFSEANPGLAPNMLALLCDGPGHQIREIRLCLDKQLRFHPCGRDIEDSCHGNELQFTPVNDNQPAKLLP